MTYEGKGGRVEALGEIAAARRATMLKFAIEQEGEKHYSEALDMYRQVVGGYPGTGEEAEARQRMLSLAHRFGSGNQPYRMLSIYGALENLYAHERYETWNEARRARVREILDEIRERDRREAMR